MRVVMHLEARAELRAASSWYGDVSGELQARFDRHIIATIDRISENPQQFPFVAAERFRRAIVDVFPYVLYFEVLPGRIKSLAVTHGSANLCIGYIGHKPAASQMHRSERRHRSKHDHRRT